MYNATLNWMPRSLTSSSVFQSKEGATPCPSGTTRSSPTRTRPTSTRCRTRRWPRWSSSIPHFPLRHSLDHITLCADNCFIYLTNVKYKSFCAKLPLLSFGASYLVHCIALCCWEIEFSEIEMCKNHAEQIMGLIAHSEQFSTAHFPRKEAEKWHSSSTLYRGLKGC